MTYSFLAPEYSIGQERGSSRLTPITRANASFKNEENTSLSVIRIHAFRVSNCHHDRYARQYLGYSPISTTTRPQSVDQFSQQIESGLFSLRARQSTEGTSCEIRVNPAYVGVKDTNMGFGSATEVLELSHLRSNERDERLRCCDATTCSWEPPYRLINREGTRSSKTVGIKLSQENYMLSPPGMSTDSDSLIILVRSNNEQNNFKHPLPIRCVELSTAGHLHRGTWEKSRCRRR